MSAFDNTVVAVPLPTIIEAYQELAAMREQLRCNDDENERLQGRIDRLNDDMNYARESRDDAIRRCDSLRNEITTLRRQLIEQAQATGEFSVTLLDFGANKINVIKCVREVTALGLLDAKNLVEAAPSLLRKNISEEEAHIIARKIDEFGGRAQVNAPVQAIDDAPVVLPE